jgi:chromate transport protein ChrA
VNERPTPSALDLFLGFMNVGLTSVGGAAGPLRHVVVKSRKWMSEGELAELFGLSQALPGATVVNVAIMFGDRCAGLLGALAGVLGLCGPALIVALLLASVATRLSAANPHFAGAELAVTAAVAGIFLSNGTRLIAQLWNDHAIDVGPLLRCARVAISALGIVLVAGFHLWIPYAVVILVACGLVVERSVEARTARA